VQNNLDIYINNNNKNLRLFFLLSEIKLKSTVIIMSNQNIYYKMLWVKFFYLNNIQIRVFCLKYISRDLTSKQQEQA
jgi:hypothetical protein